MKKIIVVLDNVRSVFNVGSIFRTADAVGNTEIYICGITPTPDNHKIKKTSLGSEKSVKWQYFPNTLDAIKKLKQKNIPIYSVEITPESQHFQKFEYSKTKTICLVFGHELHGVSQPVLDASDHCVFIPMAGIKESLNVSITASVLLYEAFRYNQV